MCTWNVFEKTLTDSLYTWDPLVINFKRYWIFLERMNQKKGIWNKIKWFFGSYRFVTDDGIKDHKELAKVIRYDPALSIKESVYCSVVFGILFGEFVSHLIKMKGCGYTDKLLSTLYLMVSMSSLNQFMNQTKIGKIMEQMRWMFVIGLLGCDRLFGMDKTSMIFDANKYYIAKALRCSGGVLISGLTDSYKSIAGLCAVVFAGWSWKNQMFRLKDSDDEDKIKN